MKISSYPEWFEGAVESGFGQIYDSCGLLVDEDVVYADLETGIIIAQVRDGEGGHVLCSTGGMFLQRVLLRPAPLSFVPFAPGPCVVVGP